MTQNAKRCALILAGCGAKDGAEITEAVSLLIALSQEGFVVTSFAPDREQYHVLNHITDTSLNSEKRNILVESARIARGNVYSLETIQESDFDVLCFSGGFGVAKNLCDFAFEGKNAVLEADIQDVLYQFIEAKKVIAGLCISPILFALAAKELNIKNVAITLGQKSSVSDTVESWGIVHQPKQTFEACIDAQNKFVSAPAYMDDEATPADIFASAAALVHGIEQLL